MCGTSKWSRSADLGNHGTAGDSITSETHMGPPISTLSAYKWFEAFKEAVRKSGKLPTVTPTNPDRNLFRGWKRFCQWVVHHDPTLRGVGDFVVMIHKEPSNCWGIKNLKKFPANHPPKGGQVQTPSLS